jgi:hypothetical protein
MGKKGLDRYAPLTGVVFVVLIVVAIVIGGETPDNSDPAQEIASFWKDNDTEQIWSSVIGAWSLVFFVWFAASVRSALRRVEDGAGRLTAVSFAGAVIATIGLLLALSLTFSIADGADELSAGSLKTLTVLSNGIFLPIAAGFALFFLATGILAVRSRLLPVWLGWLTIVLGVICLTPVGFFALLVGLIWVLAVSVMLYMRGAGRSEQATAK